MEAKTYRDRGETKLGKTNRWVDQAGPVWWQQADPEDLEPFL